VKYTVVKIVKTGILHPTYLKTRNPHTRLSGNPENADGGKIKTKVMPLQKTKTDSNY
jgi:hypothetical protein